MAGITEPLALPEWATNPPAAPPTTIVEPTSTEKAEGFQPTSVVQQVDITIEEVLDATEYSLLINEELVEITSGSPTTDVEIRDALIAEAESISAITDVVFFTAISDTVFRISALEPGQAFSVTLGEDGQLSAATTTANTTGKPVRQFFNWLFVTIYLWIRWFIFSAFQWSDISGGWDVKSLGTLPTTGAGLDGTSGAAVSYINGHRVSGVVEAHTYPDEADVYVDLKDDGTWTYVVVANGAGAPAVTADSRRQWKVVTDSVDRVSVADLRTSFISIASTITWTFLGPLNAVNVDCNDVHVGGVLTADGTAELGGGANVASFLNVAGGGTFQNNVLCEADYEVLGDYVYDDTELKTCYRSIPGSEGVFSGAYTDSDAVRYVLTAVGENQPSRLNLSSAGTVDRFAHYHLDMPDLAKLIAVSVTLVNTDAVSTELGVFRFNSIDPPESLVTAGSYTTVASTPAYAAVSLTVDAAPNNVVANSTHSYVLVVKAKALKATSIVRVRYTYLVKTIRT